MKEYAVFNEYGTSKIPARPFFRTSTKDNDSRSIIQSRVNDEVSKVLHGDIQPSTAFERIGLFVKGRIQRSTTSGNWVSNSEATIRKKGSNKPLVDTGTLVNSIDYEVE